MIKNSRSRIFALIAAAVISASACSACSNSGREADWEDTLPSAAAKSTSGTIQVITEDSNPPISIEMPETTAAPETKGTEFPTSAGTRTETEENTLTDIPTVPISEFTSTVPSSSNQTESSSEEPSYSSQSDSTYYMTEVAEIVYETGTTISENDPDVTSGSLQDSDSPYVFNDPISRPYVYSTLTEKQRSCYNLIVNAINNYEDNVTFPSSLALTKDDYYYLYDLIYNNENSFFYISPHIVYRTNRDTGILVSVEISYIYTKDEVESMQKEIDEAANNIIAQITEDMSEYDIVKLFYDSLVKGCVYDLEAENLRDIYGTLVTGRAVCAGYAKSFSYLCDKVGIQTLTITGDFDGVAHMWNMVKLGGNWYHVDVTSGFVAEDSYVRYDYFCVTDEAILRSHTVDDQDYSYPAATSDKYSYFVYNGLVVNSYEDAYEKFTDAIVEAANNNEQLVQFMCSDDDVFNEVVYEFFTRKAALNIYEDAYERAENKFNVDSIRYNQEQKTRVIKLFIEYTE